MKRMKKPRKARKIYMTNQRNEVIMESANPAVMEALTQKEDHDMSGI